MAALSEGNCPRWTMHTNAESRHNIPSPGVGSGVHGGSTSAASGTPPSQSGSRPARKMPRPTPSGTSGTRLDNHSIDEANLGGECGASPAPAPPEADREESIGIFLPDVPDGDSACRTEPPGLPDVCRTDTEVLVPTPARDDSTTAASGSSGNDPAPEANGSLEEPALIVNGILHVGPMTTDRERFEVLENPELQGMLLQANVLPDTVIEAEPKAEITFVDADSHDWAIKPSREECEAYAAAIHPRPDAAWTTHGNGLRAVYIGADHRQRALGAAFSVPSSFSVSLLNTSRHPGSASSKHVGQTCGPVTFNINDRSQPYKFHTVGRLTPELRQQALQKLGFEDGGRYDHDRCPIDSGVDSDAKGCVRVLGTGIYCHRCAAHSVPYRPHLKAGFLPFSLIVGASTTDLDTLAEHWVHWNHARLQLHHQYPHLADPLLREAYELVLRARWEKDPRARAVFVDDLDFLWGEGLWLDHVNLQPTRMDNDAAGSLPYVQYANKKSGKTGVNKLRRAQVKHRTPRGYMPVRPVRGISFAANDGVIPVTMPPASRYPIGLLNDPMSEGEAFALLEQAFPLLSRTYLTACLAAGICGDVANGQPPMLACTGPSGSGKEQNLRLAASFMGQDSTKMWLTDDQEVFARQIGVAITAGHRFLVFDELGKARDLVQKLTPLLQLSHFIQWRPLHQNRLVNTKVRGAFFYPCTRFPDFLAASPEFLRRTRRMHLHRKVPNWEDTSGGDTAAWRDRSEANARIANSILTHSWRLCHEHSFRFL